MNGAESYTKMNRDEWVTYLDTTPDTEPTFAILGVGVTEMSEEYNPSVESEKWIIERNSRHIHESNEKTSDIEQSIYTNDPCYQFAFKGRGKLNYKTKILDIDMTKKSESGDKYYAELSDGLLAVSSHLGENASIGYTLYWEGDPKIGYVTMADGKPTFKEGNYAETIALNSFTQKPVVSTKENKGN